MMKGSKREKSDFQEDSRLVISISSSDDEEANKDPSLATVERAREWRKGKEIEVIDVSASSEDIDAVMKSKNRKSKAKKKKKKDDGKEQDTDKLQVDGPVSKEEPLGTTNPGITEENGASDNLIFRKLLRGPRYFDPAVSNPEACFMCGKDCHTIVNCPERRERPCFVCGMFGHNAKQCSQGQDCFNCRRRGHIAKNCPDKHTHSSQDSVTCLRCGDLGHDMLSCNYAYAPDDLKGVQCYICKNYGHLCCIDFLVDSGIEVSCYNCAQSGHNGLVCAKSNGDCNDFTSSSLCYNCGERGHFARWCTKITQGCGKPHGGNNDYASPSLCYRCNGEGHFARDCKKDAKGCGKPRGDTSDYATPNLCYKCDEEGHFARDCTKDMKMDRWEGGSTPWRFSSKNRDSGGFRSAPHDFRKAHKKKSTPSPYEERWNKSCKPGRKGGWITDDPGDLPKRKHRARVWNSPSAIGRIHKVDSPYSVENYSSSRSPFKRHEAFTGTPRGVHKRFL